MARMQVFLDKLRAYAPEWKGPVPPEDGARAMLRVMESADIQQGNAGRCVSYFGSTEKWM